MGKIKSALEIALEKTENLSIDRDRIKRNEIVSEARKIIAGFINNEIDENTLKKDLESLDESSVKQAIKITITNLIAIPAGDRVSGLDKLPFLSSLVSDGPDLKSLIGQAVSLLKEYPGQRKALLEHMKAQYAPILREKERKLSEEYGRDVRLNAENDKDFLKAYSENLKKLDEQYTGFIEEIRTRVNDLIRI